jgi:hypothetical protein
VTCVKLKYVQLPVGKRVAAGGRDGDGGSGGDIIRPSKWIIYDATEGVVSFLSTAAFFRSDHQLSGITRMLGIAASAAGAPDRMSDDWTHSAGIERANEDWMRIESESENGARSRG